MDDPECERDSPPSPTRPRQIDISSGEEDVGRLTSGVVWHADVYIVSLSVCVTWLDCHIDPLTCKVAGGLYVCVGWWLVVVWLMYDVVRIGFG